MPGVGNEPASNSTASCQQELAAYDQLPPRIRRLLSRSAYNFDAIGILAFYQKVKLEHGPCATQIILDWLSRVMAKQRKTEIKEGRLLPDA